MAISRSLMNRQLQADGGIMQVAPREKFGLGSKLKKFVRKIIPNEVADIAVKAAPFVAPFNPAIAAAMAGIGSFDQTGSIGSSLKRGALTYGGGQAARYLGGADFQDPSLSAFTPSGFKSGFSYPLGRETGLGKFFSNRGTEGVKGVGVNSEGSYLPFQGEEMNIPSYSEQLDIIQKGNPNQMTITESIQKILSPNSTLNERGSEALNLLKRGTKAAFTKTDAKGNIVIDKAAVIGAVTAATSYAEAKALAADAGIELTEEEYNEALKDEKKAEYGEYLQNFFAGKKDGGRIGFKDGANKTIEEKIAELESLTNKLMTEQGIQDRGYASRLASDIINMKNESIDPDRLKFLNNESALFALPRDMRPDDKYYDTLKALENRANGGRIGFESGANEMIKTQLLEEIMPVQDGEEMITIMTENGLVTIPKSVYESMPQMFMDTTTSVFGDAGRGRRIPEEFRADGGRIGFKKGSDPVYEMYLEDLEAGIIPSDKSYNEYLDDIEDDPDYDYSYAKGGRVSRKFGSPKEGESKVGIMTIDVEAGDDEDEEDMMMAAGINFSRQEKSYLFRRLGGSGGADRSYTMPNLYRILNNPGRYPEDAAVLKEIAIMGLGESRADGGRIGFNQGSTSIGNTVFGDISEIDIGESIKQSGRGLINMFSPSEIMRILSEAGEGFKQLYFNLKSDSEKENLLKTIMGDSYEEKADGGRIGYKGGANRVSELLILRDELIGKGEDVSDIEAEIFQLTGKTFKSVGGISDVPTGKMRKNNAGVVERDYRDEGGFVPVGIKERADDVPAMLSKNEFVMTADAVRGIGNGSVEEGSKKLYNTMKQAEKVGKA